MKRFWLVLLSLGLIMAFSASAFAVDVKFSGDYTVAGVYLNKIAVDNGFEGFPGEIGSHNPSTAFYYQRLRIGTDFIVAPCLKLVTKLDALDRIWGGARSDADSSGWAYNQATPNTGGTSGTRAESENIVMDLLYLEYTSPVGLFKVGYQSDFTFGTVFGDRSNGTPSGQIQYFIPIGPVVLFAGLAKEIDNSASAIPHGYSATRTDRDFDSYRIAGIFNFNTSQAKGEAGALLLWNRDATNRGTFSGPADAGPFLTNAFNLVPYFKATVGPVALQGELNYGFGNARKYESYFTQGPGESDMTISTLSVFLDATVNLGMVYAGGSFAYVSGQDIGKTDQVQSGVGNTGGLDWNPCLILFNTDLDYWAGDIAGHTNSVVNGEMVNAWFFQGRVGVKPTPKLDAMVSVSYAMADKKVTPYEVAPGVEWYAPTPGGSYGLEVDITGTYKITNNLSYMLGMGYLFTGDYFKGLDAYQNSFGNAKVSDDFIVINKLTLSF
jgi:hypothetical protein